jgi:hypothetical protein
MNRFSALVIAALFAAGCAPASPEHAAIREAAAALGGADRLLALKAMTIEGSGTAPNAGQNRLPDDELPVWKVNAYTRTVDLASGRTRIRQEREAQFLFAGATKQQQTQGLDGDVAYNVTPDGTITRARRTPRRATAGSSCCITRLPSSGRRSIPRRRSATFAPMPISSSSTSRRRLATP